MRFNDLSSPIALLHSRRSAKPREMISPGPDSGQLAQILAAATRVPDHGKLAPWRFIIVSADQREKLRDVLVNAYRGQNPDAGRLEIEAMENMARQAPALVIALYSPKPGKIPEWEQQLSMGAACMQMLNATHALGFVGCWLTGWPCYSDAVRDAFGAPHEKIAGFFYLGSSASEPSERPRPEPNSVISMWDA